MKRGAKGLPPSDKAARGTSFPYRDAGKQEVDVLSQDGALASPHGLPQRPDWLTEAGGEIWLDDVGRASRMASEVDSTIFANYCNLQGAIVLAWKSGAVPPAAHLMEARRMAEQFGLFGRKSRILAGGGAAGSGAPASTNPFDRLKKK